MLVSRNKKWETSRLKSALEASSLSAQRQRSSLQGVTRDCTWIPRKVACYGERDRRSVEFCGVAEGHLVGDHVGGERPHEFVVHLVGEVGGVEGLRNGGRVEHWGVVRAALCQLVHALLRVGGDVKGGLPSRRCLG
ncbi:CUB domain-containing protein [Babesia caballi]|uniref:CUB domain-containing protein n=1 Tax=Babesia caballi TaxID=5871 RepID=A0AAV4LSI5_BABCB|nr:CUB domain-containing protein [Babesia caballi]